MFNWKPGIRFKDVPEEKSVALSRLLVTIASMLKLDPKKLAAGMRTQETKDYAKRLIAALDTEVKKDFEKAVKHLTRKE